MCINYIKFQTYYTKLINNINNTKRGIELLFVFIYHYNKNVLQCSYIGVDILFILSGYVITLSNLYKTKWIDFYSKRIVRLYPQQILCMFVVFVEVNKFKLITYITQIDNIISALLSYSNYNLFNFSNINIYN